MSFNCHCLPFSEALIAKLALIAAVEAKDLPEASFLEELQRDLQALGPALLQEAQALGTTGEVAARIEAIGAQVAKLGRDSPLAEQGVWEFPSSSSPGKSYRVVFGRAGHLECDCPGFAYRGQCKHVREARQASAC